MGYRRYGNNKFNKYKKKSSRSRSRSRYSYKKPTLRKTIRKTVASMADTKRQIFEMYSHKEVAVTGNLYHRVYNIFNDTQEAAQILPFPVNGSLSQDVQGNKYYLTNILYTMRFQFQTLLTAGLKPTTTRLRIMIINAHDNEDLAPQGASLPYSFSTTDIDAPIPLSILQLYNILYDKSFEVGAAAQSAARIQMGHPNEIVIKYKHKLFQEVRVASATACQGLQARNNLQMIMMFYAADGVLTGAERNGFLFTVSCEYFYKDI